MANVGLTISERFIRAKVQMRKKYPFFAHLCFYLEMHQVEKDDPRIGGGWLSTSPKGDIYYCPAVMEPRTDEQLIAHLCHEVLHLALGHFLRKGSREHNLWNWACDIKDNDILVTEGIRPASDKGLPMCPDAKHHIQIGKLDIDDIDKKSTEEIYSELIQGQNEGQLPKQEPDIIGFHLFGMGADGDGDGDGDGKPGMMGGQSRHEKLQKIATEWVRRMIDAKTQTELARGTVPGAIDEILKNILDPQIDWRVFVEQFVERSIISDFSYRRPRKTYYDNGIYLPSVVRESLFLVYHIDSSGSMMPPQLQKALGGLYSLLHAHPNVTAWVLVGDTELAHEIKLTTDESDDILDLVKMKGRGGTSHQWVVDWINKNTPEVKVFVSFTDGCSDIEHCYDALPSTCERLIVLTDGGRPDLKKYGELIMIANERDD